LLVSRRQAVVIFVEALQQVAVAAHVLHVDLVAKLPSALSRDGVGGAFEMSLELAAQAEQAASTGEADVHDLARFVAEKGSIAVDGVSLTVTSVDERSFSVALVSYTQDHVANGLFSTGKTVNLEVDVLAKYVEKLVVH